MKIELIWALAAFGILLNAKIFRHQSSEIAGHFEPGIHEPFYVSPWDQAALYCCSNSLAVAVSSTIFHFDAAPHGRPCRHENAGLVNAL